MTTQNGKKKKGKRASMMSRYSVVLVIIMLAAGWITYNAFRNAVFDREQWNNRAEREMERIVKRTKIVAPERGDILAADGSVLSTTMQLYTLRIDFGSPRFDWEGYVQAKDSLADSLACYFPISGGRKAWIDSLERPLRRAMVDTVRSRNWKLINFINYADFERIKTFPFFKDRNRMKHGLKSEPMKRRRAPYGNMARLSIGIVGEQPNKEIHGISGLELALDSLLYGKPGVNKLVTLSRGLGRWEKEPAIRGWDVQSTINVQMQDLLEDALLNRLKYCKAEWGSAILMEVATGEIKAICNLEENPSKPAQGEYIEAMNRAIRRWEPGSVVKTLSMMIAIDDGYVTNLDSVINIGQSFKAYGLGRPITDSHYNSQLTVAGTIEQSSNIGVAKILSHYYKDPQEWHDRIAATGFLDRLDSGFGEEVRPYFPVVPLNAGGMTTLSRQFYGYSCEIPPLYTLSLYNAIANGGRYVRPRLIKGLHREGVDSVVPVSYVRDRICSERTATMMRQCLSLVVNGDRGTARSLKNPYVKLAGKTGTCYSINPDTKQYDTGRKRLAFCGYFPADNPKYSCVVLTYHPRENAMGAASTSGTVVRDLAISMYARGMLDNVSDYLADERPDDYRPRPTAFASLKGTTVRAVNNNAGIKPRVIAAANPQRGKVPEVAGMGLREAITTLESYGFDVTFSGSGRVAAQTLTDSRAIHLTLKQ